MPESGGIRNAAILAAIARAVPALDLAGLARQGCQQDAGVTDGAALLCGENPGIGIRPGGRDSRRDVSRRA